MEPDDVCEVDVSRCPFLTEMLLDYLAIQRVRQMLEEIKAAKDER